MDKRNILRGDLFFANLDPVIGSEQGGTRPVLIIQNDKGNECSPTTIVAAVTTVEKKEYLPTHVKLWRDYGLEEESMVMLEQIRTIDKTRLERYIGHVSDSAMGTIDNALRVSVNLPGRKEKPAKEHNQQANGQNQPEVMELCLCPVCAKQFYYSPDHVIRRIDPMQHFRERCDYCEVRDGYDYRVTKRKKHIGDDC